MLTVTDKAARYLREALGRRQDEMPEALRIVYAEGSYQLTLDDRKQGDQVFEHEGQSYLLVGEELREALGDAMIDVNESSQGASLTLLAAGSPQAKADPASEPGAESGPEPKP